MTSKPLADRYNMKERPSKEMHFCSNKFELIWHDIVQLALHAKPSNNAFVFARRPYDSSNAICLLRENVHLSYASNFNTNN
jgi:hypothetical protein